MGKLKKAVLDPLSDNNPITVQVLGICSALAVTIKVETALVMALALTSVLTCSNFFISLLRNAIPVKIRMIVEVTVIASLVILTDNLLKAYMFEASRQLSVFVGLIITNCIVMGRAEGFALQNPPGISLVDGVGNGLGYSAVLIVVASLREIFASGTWYDYRILPLSYEGNGLVILAPGGFIIIGLIIWAQRSVIGNFEGD